MRSISKKVIKKIAPEIRGETARRRPREATLLTNAGGVDATVVGESRRTL